MNGFIIYTLKLQWRWPHRNYICDAHLHQSNQKCLAWFINVFSLGTLDKAVLTQISHMLQWHAALALITGWHPWCFGGCLGPGSFWVALLNLIKQLDPLRWIRAWVESAAQRGLYAAAEVKRPGVSMHHTQENIRQLPDSPGPGSPAPKSLPARQL